MVYLPYVHPFDWSSNNNAHKLHLDILLIYICTPLINTYVDSSVPIQYIDFKTSYKTNVTHKNKTGIAAAVLL